MIFFISKDNQQACCMKRVYIMQKRMRKDDRYVNPCKDNQWDLIVPSSCRIYTAFEPNKPLHKSHLSATFERVRNIFDNVGYLVETQCIFMYKNMAKVKSYWLQKSLFKRVVNEKIYSNRMFAIGMLCQKFHKHISNKGQLLIAFVMIYCIL